jgi:hypothetical protein
VTSNQADERRSTKDDHEITGQRIISSRDTWYLSIFYKTSREMIVQNKESVESPSASASASVAADFTSANRKKWQEPFFWRKLCPELTIDAKKPPTTAIPKIEKDAASLHTDRRSRLADRGYALADEPVADLSVIQAMRTGIETLHKLGLPASFILLFDNTWDLAALSRSVLEKSTLETNKFQFDILAWYIDSGGFSPHRDRQPEDVAASFEKDDAKFATHWIALTDATPENSCLYVIPKGSDPGYKGGDTEEEDPLRRALPNKEAFQQIRALPRQQGQSVLFTHRIIHWGSARDPASLQPPRIAISFVCSDPTFEKPYVDPTYFSSEKAPPFHIRMLLVCAQLLIYYQRFNLPKECIKACYEYCKDYEEELEDSYRKKVFVEFVKAMNEAASEDAAESTVDSLIVNDSIDNGKAFASGKNAGDDEDDSDEDEEAVMEEMLNAEKGGYGEFADDYDELGEEEEEGGDFDDDDEDDDDEEGMTLFGKRDASADEEDSTTKKRAKTSSP